MGLLSSSGDLAVWRLACAAPRCGNRCFRSGQRKAIIRTLHRLEMGSDYMGLVRLKGLEPTRIAAREPKSRMSTNSITGAYFAFCRRPLRHTRSGPRENPPAGARTDAAGSGTSLGSLVRIPYLPPPVKAARGILCHPCTNFRRRTRGLSDSFLDTVPFRR